MLSQRVSRTITQHAMLSAGDRVLIALSGGPDSVALTRLLHGLQSRLKVELALAHLDHRMRPDAAEDTSFSTLR